ncbi:MAG: hypothetical protein ACR2NQ_00975 [Thermodesulfobacteriota bacterium]
MVTTPEKVNVLLLMVGFLFVWAIWSFGLRPMLVDSFRQRVFEIRDEMFYYAAKSGVDFNHPAYGTLRTMMNGYIRFAHKIDSVLILAFTVYSLFRKEETKKNSEDFKKRIESELSPLPEVQKKEMINFVKKTERELVWYVVYASPLFIAVAMPLALVGALLLLVKKLLVQLLIICKVLTDVSVEMEKHFEVSIYSNVLNPTAFREGKQHSTTATA